MLQIPEGAIFIELLFSQRESLIPYPLLFQQLLETSFIGFNLMILINSGRKSGFEAGIRKHSTAAALEEPINPGVSVNYNQLLINGKFVDAASGWFPDRFLACKLFVLRSA